VEDDWLEAAYEDQMSMAEYEDWYFDRNPDATDRDESWLDEEEDDAALAGDQHPA
jgi:hypothetical protein